MTTPDPREALREAAIDLAYALDGIQLPMKAALAVTKLDAALAQAAPPPDGYWEERAKRAEEQLRIRNAYIAQAAPPPEPVTFDHDGSDRPVDGFGIVEAAPQERTSEYGHDSPTVPLAFHEAALAQAAPPPDRAAYLARAVLRQPAAPPSVLAHSICECGLAESYHPRLAAHEYKPRYAAPPSGLDEEHCCGDLSHMSAEYIAALRSPDTETER